ncbi:MAG: UDP-N-acetylmuramate--L-alanine ligase [Flavobacteriaceae bacterium]
MKNHKTYFMIGIGGIGMSALAIHLVQNGARVWGYDREESQITQKLSAMGVDILYDANMEALPEEIKNKSVEVIYSAAISNEHPQWQFFAKQGNKMFKRAAFLGQLSNQNRSIAIGGTHGKTTTTALLAHIMFTDKRKFSAFVGGVMKQYDSNYITTGNDFIILEADEYDRSFLQLYPTIGAITAMDADHMEIYKSIEGMHEGYAAFAGQVQEKFVVAENLPLSGITYGFEPTADYSIKNIEQQEKGFFFDVVTPEHIEKGLFFNQLGRHNLKNALCALTLARLEGVSFKVIRKALASFPGIDRRLNQYALGDRILLDDYAHHPVELEALLETVKSTFSDRKNCIVFQPHLFSRTRDFMMDFATVLSQFDQIILLEIYPAREQPIEGITASTLLDHIANPQKRICEKEALVNAIEASGASLVVVAGAGDIGLEVQKLTPELNPIT